MSSLQTRLGRPVIVTLFAVGVLIISVILIAGGVKTLQIWRHPDQSLPQLPLVYAIFRNFLLGIGGGVMVWGLLGGKTWAPWLGLAYVVLFIISYWLEWFLLVDPIDRGGSFTFTACLSILAILITWLVLFYNPGSRSFFGDKHD